MTTFQHADGRIMVAEEAGGTGGGITSVHHRLATEEESTAFKTSLVPEEVEPVHDAERFAASQREAHRQMEEAHRVWEARRHTDPTPEEPVIEVTPQTDSAPPVEPPAPIEPEPPLAG